MGLWHHEEVRLTDKHITDFQNLYLESFGIVLTKEEALAKGIQLLSLFEVVLKQNAKTAKLQQGGNNSSSPLEGMINNKNYSHER